MPAARRHFRAGFAVSGPGSAAAVRAVVVGGEGEPPLALVALDVDALDPEVIQRCASACPLPDEQVVVLCCGGDGPVPAGGPDASQTRRLALATGDAVRRAASDAVPCRLGWGHRSAPEGGWWHLLKIERSDSARTPICGLWAAGRLGMSGQGAQPPWPSLRLPAHTRGSGAPDPIGAVTELWNITPTANAGPWGWRRAQAAAANVTWDVAAWRAHNGGALFWPGRDLDMAVPPGCLAVAGPLVAPVPAAAQDVLRQSAAGLLAALW